MTKSRRLAPNLFQRPSAWFVAATVIAGAAFLTSGTSQAATSSTTNTTTYHCTTTVHYGTTIGDSSADAEDGTAFGPFAPTPDGEYTVNLSAPDSVAPAANVPVTFTYSGMMNGPTQLNKLHGQQQGVIKYTKTGGSATTLTGAFGAENPMNAGGPPPNTWANIAPNAALPNPAPAVINVPGAGTVAGDTVTVLPEGWAFTYVSSSLGGVWGESYCTQSGTPANVLTVTVSGTTPTDEPTTPTDEPTTPTDEPTTPTDEPTTPTDQPTTPTDTPTTPTDNPTDTSSPDPSAAPSLPANVPSSDGAVTVEGDVVKGGDLTLSGGGFGSGSGVTAGVYSTPKNLGTTTADDSGDASVDVTLPSGLTGKHTLVLAGTDSDGAPRYLTASVTIAAESNSTATDDTDTSTTDSDDGTSNSTTSTGTLASTGSDTVTLAIVALLLLQGGAIMTVRTRRARPVVRRH